MGSRRTRIEFGTSGWRGVVGRDFTAAGARALVRAIGERVARRVGAGASIVIGHDTRPGGESLAREAAGVLRGLGLRPLLCAGATPTPVVSFTVRRRRAAAGLVFTASHNPPEYQGLKWIAPDGGAAPASENEPVARRANALLGRVPAPSSAAPRPILPAPAYQRALLTGAVPGGATGGCAGPEPGSSPYAETPPDSGGPRRTRVRNASASCGVASGRGVVGVSGWRPTAIPTASPSSTARVPSWPSPTPWPC
jgi:hypothetical protein